MVREEQKIPLPRQLSEKQLGPDDEIWFTSRRRDDAKNGRNTQGEQKGPDQLAEQRHREELELNKQAKFLQQFCPGARIDDFDQSKVMEYAKKKLRVEQLPTEDLNELCKRLGWILSQAGTPQRTIVLAFHKSPHNSIHSALVGVIAITPGNERDSSSEQIGGPLSDQINKTIKWMKRNLRTISENVGADQRIDRSEIPEPVLRELVANAIVHRDYEAKENVRVEITAEQVIITNPGILKSAILETDPPFSYRNPHPYNPGLLQILIDQGSAEGHFTRF